MKKQKILIELKDVFKTYETGDGGFTALNGINIEILQGEFLGITGKSGAGKSTLLNMISGVGRITEGKVLFSPPDSSEEPFSIHDMDEDELAIWRGENLGVVYQSFELLPFLSLVDNVMLAPDFSGSYHPITTKTRALEVLDVVEIMDHAYKIPAHISGGQKQRLAIARALINDPPLIIADEPTGNLDSKTAETIFTLFENLVESGKTVVMVTHDEELAPRFTRNLTISDGSLIQDKEKDVLTVKPTGKKAVNGRRKQNKKNGNGHKKEYAAIDLRSVVKTYENAAGKFTALKGVDLKLEYGEFVSIVGKSGSGKSTLLNMITGIDHPTTGEVVIGNNTIYDMTESDRALWRGKNIGIVFQFFQLLPTLNLLENILLPMDYTNTFKPKERTERAMKLLASVGLEEQIHQLPASLSSGQQQSAAIARSLATDPPIIVADEPTGNLDTKSADIIIKLFNDLAAQGKTIALVTHDPSLTQRTQRTVVISDGEIIDEIIPQSFPSLEHPQMLALTKGLSKKVFSPGDTIIKQGEKVDDFFIIEKGKVEILVTYPDCPEVNVGSLEPGDYFGDVELIHGNNSIATVKAGPHEKVEVAKIEKEKFEMILSHSKITKEMLTHSAQSRFDNNKNHSNGNC